MGADSDREETQEWLDSLEAVASRDKNRAYYLMSQLSTKARHFDLTLPYHTSTLNINTYSDDEAFPGDCAMEKCIRRVLRWNMLMMVVRANRKDSAIGGHLSTPASICHIYEIGFNHFFRGKDSDDLGDLVFFQGHSSPIIYSRSFLEGRLDEKQLDHFRKEVGRSDGLSSYPHPRLMPDYWEFSTVSLGIGGVSAIYTAKLLKHLDSRGLSDTKNRHVWAFLGDGEMDEHQNLGPLWVAAHGALDNLTYVINCNLQRLDGLTRGNSNTISYFESLFVGFGWNVIKVVWNSAWDSLFAKDHEGALAEALSQLVDGEIQRMRIFGATWFREFFAKNPKISHMIDGWSDEELLKLRRGGHDDQKLFTALKRAREHKNQPTVILVHTVKGFGIPSLSATNTAHSKKKLTDDELKVIRDMYQIPFTDKEVEELKYYHPGEDSEEVRYLKARREALGGFLPKRTPRDSVLKAPDESLFQDTFKGSERPVSTTMHFVRILSKLMKDKHIGKYVMPIVSDEARTFGMEGLFSQVKIYAEHGQKYTPHDSDQLTKYAESQTRSIHGGRDYRRWRLSALDNGGYFGRHKRCPSYPLLYLLLHVWFPTRRRRNLGSR